MNYNVKNANKQLLVTIEGDLDAFTCKEFKEKVLEKIVDDTENIYIDASNLKYIDSTGLGALLSVYKRIKEKGNHIYIENVKPNIKKIFQITDLDKVFVIKE